MLAWKTSRREIQGAVPLVMAVLNATPDSFSDGGIIATVEDALRRVEQAITDGADILDVGGESTRPGSSRLQASEEMSRVIPIVEAITRQFDIPVAIDTSKSEVAESALGAGAEIINDISGLRFDERIASVAAASHAGLVLMHSRGEFESMHTQPPVEDILTEVSSGLRWAIAKAESTGVQQESIVLDVGIGFGKTPEQNLELLAKLDRLVANFPQYPMLVGTSRKSFIGKVLDGAPVTERLAGSLATAAVAAWNGASILRVHDVKETVDVVKLVNAMKNQL